jgi:hypothetical protein
VAVFQVRHYVVSRAGLLSGPTEGCELAPSPIRCAADLPDGTTCGEMAAETSARYQYAHTTVAGTQCILREIHYRAVWPQFGNRALVEGVKT